MSLFSFSTVLFNSFKNKNKNICTKLQSEKSIFVILEVSCQFDSRELTLLKQPRFKQSIGVSWCLATEISNEWAN